MLKYRYLFVGALLAAGPAVALAADSVPVIEISPGPNHSTSGNGYGGQDQLFMMVQQLQDEVRSLRGQLETQQHRLDQMQREQQDRYRDIDRRLSLLMTGGAMAPSQPASDATASEAASGSPEVSMPQAGVGGAAPPVAGNDADAYQAAFALVRERKFDQAAAAFEHFIGDYPNSDRLANAHYWLGEIYLAQQKLDASRQAFSKVVERFPKSPKVPDALYKLGVLYHQLGKDEESSQYLKRVIKEYPDSSAARLAQNFQR